MNTFDKVYDLVASVPKGKVTTYGAIAKLLSIDPRVVGFALHANSDSQTIPCHRVINSKGEISSGYAFGGAHIQKQMLGKEGIKFNVENKVDLKKYGYLLS
ncbi:MAG: MGMT family protein [Candidatus Levybacteria bacterium]|nr:MGMT family protein [Candidatus Levybacteria bacterium]